jgi:hypothetical protein
LTKDDRFSFTVDRRTGHLFSNARKDKDTIEFIQQLLKEHEELGTMKQKLRDLEKQQNGQCSNGSHCTPPAIQETNLAIPSENDVPMGMLKEANPERDALIKRLKETATTEQFQEDDSFNCQKLCKWFYSCMHDEAKYVRGEIEAIKCYEPKYPNYCPYMSFERTLKDTHFPCPTCLAKQKDAPLELPKDRIIRDPEFCWRCMKIAKAQRQVRQQLGEARIVSRATRDQFAGQPRVDWEEKGNGSYFNFSME